MTGRARRAAGSLADDDLDTHADRNCPRVNAVHMKQLVLKPLMVIATACVVHGVYGYRSETLSLSSRWVGVTNTVLAVSGGRQTRAHKRPVHSAHCFGVDCFGE